MTRRKYGGVSAVVCLIAFLCGYIPASGATLPQTDDAHVLQLLNGQSCAQRESSRTLQNLVAQATPEPAATNAPSASPAPGPTFIPISNGSTQLFETPRPAPTASGGPPPVPTPTPTPSGENAPIFLVRTTGQTPPPITPAGRPTPTPSPQPTGVATLAPNYVAVLADDFTGNREQGAPGDAIGNVHIFYSQDEIVGDHAHYDGLRTVTITGHSYIINHAHDSVLLADKIVFDTISQTAVLTNGHGASSQGVDRGLVHFNAQDLHTDADGTGHGLAPAVSTCENSRSGYHITGRNMDVYPGDKIVIYRAILWLGAAAVFFLPKVVIPLRTVDNQQIRPKFFPDVGYDSFEGYWIKTQLGFGKDQYYYGYYRVNYFSKVGLGLGYVGFFAKRNGRRSASIDFYEINDKRVGTSNANLNFQEIENFSQTLKGNIQAQYQSNYGPYTGVPSTTNIATTVAHQGAHSSDQYGFTRQASGSTSSSDAFSFTDNRQFSSTFNNAVSITLADSASNLGALSTNTSNLHFDSVTHFTTTGADYQLTIDKQYTPQAPAQNDDKLPELEIRPYKVLPHFIVPISAQFTAGEYSEPLNNFSTQAANLNFVFGPEIAKVFGSDFSSTVNVQQDAFATGDLKAQIQQNLALTTPIGRHFVNSITYTEQNYNGPGAEPFEFFDQQPTQLSNTKTAQDLVRLFNGDAYTASLGFSTNFQGRAQPVSYQISARPSYRSLVLIGGSFSPGPGLGFSTTNVQLSEPLGPNTQFQLVTDVDWKNKERLENKVAYLTKTIGDCYQLQLYYNQSQKSVTAQVNILAFPTQGATFNLGQSGPLVPSTFNF